MCCNRHYHNLRTHILPNPSQHRTLSFVPCHRVFRVRADPSYTLKCNFFLYIPFRVNAKDSFEKDGTKDSFEQLLNKCPWFYLRMITFLWCLHYAYMNCHKSFPCPLMSLLPESVSAIDHSVRGQNEIGESKGAAQKVALLLCTHSSSFTEFFDSLKIPFSD